MAAGGFRGGRLCPQFQKTGEENAPFSHDEGRRGQSSSNDVEADDMQQFATQFLAKSKLMADTMMQLILLIERAPKHLWENPRFKKIVEAGQQLVSCRLATPHTEDNTRADNVTLEDQSLPNESQQEDYLEEAEKENVEETEIICNKDNEGNADTIPTKGKKRKRKQPACKDKNVGRGLRSWKEKVISDASVPPMAKRKATTSKETELVDGSANLEQKDKEIYYWLVHHATKNWEEVVFTYKNMNIRREELHSLREAPGWDDERVQSEFSDSLKLQLWRSEKHTLRNIDMFFFLVLSGDHYFIVCFDMRKREALVIDNSDEREGQTVFADYLYTEGLKTESLMVRRAYMARLEMSWRDTDNKNDCGVYVMRHMETYMGQSVNAWKCNLEKGNVFQMNVLRIKYCGSILASRLNEHAASVERSANATFAAISKKKTTQCE
ncbi:hypothetical protein C2S52_020510 [Perilla frutescens var. hirtella]|nr:hypothetical protein C2S52_020510 [Perilla frutescens var. hirtella]